MATSNLFDEDENTLVLINGEAKVAELVETKNEEEEFDETQAEANGAC